MVTPASGIRVLLASADDRLQQELRLRLRRIPDLRLVGGVTNGADAVTVARNERADVLVMDAGLPDVPAAAVVREVSASEDRPSRVVLVAETTDGLSEALDAGARGYVLRRRSAGHLVGAIRAAARGEASIPPEVASAVLTEFVRRGASSVMPSRKVRLTGAERRTVAALVAGATTNEALAEELEVSVHTVRSHLRKAMRKTGATDRTQLALWAVRTDLSDDADARPSAER